MKLEKFKTSPFTQNKSIAQESNQKVPTHKNMDYHRTIVKLLWNKDRYLTLIVGFQKSIFTKKFSRSVVSDNIT